MWKYYRYFIIAVSFFNSAQATLLFPGTDLTAILHSRAVCYCASTQSYLRNSAFPSSHSTPYETDTGSVKQSLHLRHRFRRQLCPLFSLSFQPVSNASLPSLPNAFLKKKNKNQFLKSLNVMHASESCDASDQMRFWG